MVVMAGLQKSMVLSAANRSNRWQLKISRIAAVTLETRLRHQLYPQPE
jgi:transcription elongation factor GreA-like protein